MRQVWKGINDVSEKIKWVNFWLPAKFFHLAEWIGCHRRKVLHAKIENIQYNTCFKLYRENLWYLQYIYMYDIYSISTCMISAIYSSRRNRLSPPEGFTSQNIYVYILQYAFQALSWKYQLYVVLGFTNQQRK